MQKKNALTRPRVQLYHFRGNEEGNMPHGNRTRAGAPFAVAAVLYLNNGKLTATKHNYKPAKLNNVTIGEQQI
jgi:hypothetical protein